MRSVVMAIHEVLAWLILLGLVVQVFFAGLGAFGGASWELHVAWGHSFEFLYLLLLLLSLVGRMGKRVILLSLLLFVLIWVQVLLPALQTSLPVVSALHPVNALVLIFVTHLTARAARSFRHELRAQREIASGASPLGATGV